MSNLIQSFITSMTMGVENEYPPELNSYMGDDGFLYCGNCHTRKEREIDMTAYGMGVKRVAMLCKCAKEKDDAEEAEVARKRKIAEVQRFRRNSLMDKQFESQTFDAFKVYDNNKTALQISKRYAEKFETMLEKNQGLLFYGGVGTGKSFTSACIANDLLDRGYSVIMTSFVRLLDEMQKYGESDENVISWLNQAKLLVLDDLGVERSTEYALEKVYNIVDSRYKRQLPMIITTNLSIAEMKNTDNIRQSRIYDRIFEVCYPVRFVGRSFRKAKASTRYEEMKTLLEGGDDED